MRSEHQKKVDEFMRLADQEVPTKPTIPSEEVRKLRAKLIFEEVMETIKGLGFDICIDGEYKLIQSDFDTGFIDFTKAKEEPDLVEIADGCADIKVVTTGTLSACGIDDQEIQDAVDDNNLSKFGPGSYRREDGKWVKPEGHKAPDIENILKNQSGD